MKKKNIYFKLSSLFGKVDGNYVVSNSSAGNVVAYVVGDRGCIPIVINLFYRHVNNDIGRYKNIFLILFIYFIFSPLFTFEKEIIPVG